MNSQRLAIQLMIGQGILFAAETMTIHQIGSRVSIVQLALIRGAAGLVLALIYARSVGCAVMRTKQLGLQLLRGGISLVYLWVMLYSFSRLPFADATALSYTQAASIVVFSALILGEAVTPACWVAAAIGIFGGLLIAKPAFAAWNTTYLIALAGASLNGLAFVLNRYLQRRDSQHTTMFYANLVQAAGNLPVLLLLDRSDFAATPLIGGLLFFGPIGMYLGIVAVKHAKTSVLGPYTLLRLVIGIVAGLLIFNEHPDLWSGLGSLLIMTSCLLSAGVLPVKPAILRAYALRMAAARLD